MLTLSLGHLIQTTKKLNCHPTLTQSFITTQTITPRPLCTPSLTKSNSFFFSMAGLYLPTTSTLNMICPSLAHFCPRMKLLCIATSRLPCPLTSCWVSNWEGHAENQKISGEWREYLFFLAVAWFLLAYSSHRYFFFRGQAFTRFVSTASSSYSFNRGVLITALYS